MKKGLKKLSFNALKPAKFLAALTLAFCIGLTANAQDGEEAAEEGGDDAAPSKVTLGIRSGLNLSKFVYAGADNQTSYLSGAEVGAFFTYQATNWVALSVEASWAQNGSANLVGADGTRHNFTMNNFRGNVLTYFKIPVLSVYEPKFFIGPSFDYIGHVAANSENPGSPSGIKTRYDVTDRFKSFDMGIVTGVGVDFDLKFAKLMLDARYRVGVLDINNNTNTLGNELGTTGSSLPSRAMGNSSIRTGSFGFNVGLGFSL